MRRSFGSCRRRTEPGASEQIIGCGHQIGMQLDALEAAITRPAQAAEDLSQTKIILDPLADPPATG